ncbi:hypothetical protein N7507_002097 [Penicillium longicatenatum]|nr:hypothetical protein N7507_002097 [Penicillium longicatenatum]
MAVPEAESAMSAQMREMRAQLQALREKREHIELQTLLVKEKQRLAEEEKQLRDATDKLNATIGSNVADGQQTLAVAPAARDTSSMVAAFIESVRSPNAENPTHTNGHTHNATPVNGVTKNGTPIQSGTVPPPGNTPQASNPSPAPTKGIPRYEVWKQKVEQERALAAATAASKKANGASTTPNGASAPLANQPAGKRPGEENDMSPAKIQTQNPTPPQAGNKPQQMSKKQKQKQKQMGNKLPQAGNQQSQVGDQQPQVGHQQPQVGHQQPQVGNQQPQMEHQQPQVGNQQAQVVNQQPQVENKPPQLGNPQPQPQISSTSALSDAEKRLEQRLQKLPVEQHNGQIKTPAPPTGPRERSPPRYPRGRSPSPSRLARGFSPPRSTSFPITQTQDSFTIQRALPLTTGQPLLTTEARPFAPKSAQRAYTKDGP